MRAWAGATLVATLLSASASAQEMPSDIGKDSGLLRSRAGLELASAHFRLDKGSGQYITATALADVTLRGRFSVRLTVPVDSLALDGASPRAGVGDVQLRMKVRLFESQDVLVQASLGAQFPTGDTHRGLGNGAPALVPLVTAGYEVSRFIFFLTVADAFSLRAHGPAPVNFVDPSTDQEISVTAGANLRIRKGLFGQLTATPIFPLLAADRAHPFFATTPSIGWSNSLLRLTASLQVPVAGTFRYDERAVLGALFYLP